MSEHGKKGHFALAMGMLWRYLRPFPLKLLALICLLAGSIGLSLYYPQLIRTFLDQVQMGAAADVVMVTAVLFFVTITGQKVVAILSAYVGEELGWSATNRLRVDLARHCLHLDMGFHKMRPPGELVERIDGDVTTLAEYFSELFVSLLGNTVLASGILLLLFGEDWRVGSIGVAYALLVMVFLRAVQAYVVRFWGDVRQALAEMFGFLEERLGDGLEDVRANGGEGYVMARLYPLLAKVIEVRVKAQVSGSFTFIIGFFLYVVSLVSTLAIGIVSFQQGQMTIGTVYLLVYYLGVLEGPLNSIRREIDGVQRAYASIGRIYKLFAWQPQVQTEGQAPLPSTATTAAFTDVSFAYRDNMNGENGRAVLQHISFELEAGQVLGVLGRTGSGKTTLTRLLFRLYDVDEGVISLDGQDIRQVSLANLRRHIGMVTQDVQLFAVSVRDNLTMFENYNPLGTAISDEEIMAAIELLGLGEWFRTLPHGLDTVLSSGGIGLSAGEAQLFAFTRVFLRDPQLVILDEASARLDPATEQRLERAIDHLLRGRTGIIIAHRLRTVQRADEILILDNGRVAEQGGRVVLANDSQSRFHHLLQTGLTEVLA